MSTELVTMPAAELAELRERLAELARKKSHLELVTVMFSKLSTVVGLENVVSHILKVLMETIGGSNLVIYYRVGLWWHYEDVYGAKGRLREVADPLVARAVRAATFVIDPGDPVDGTGETWVFPLLVDRELLGAVKMEGMLLTSANIREDLAPFFSYAALALFNEIANDRKLSGAFERLEAANQLLMNEIAERIKTERALQLTQFAVDRSAVGIFWIGREGRFTYVNDAGCRMFGYSREELLTMAPWDLNPWMSEQSWGKRWESLKLHGVLINETELQTRDGELLAIEVADNFISFRGDEYSCSYLRNIGKRKRAEQEMRIKERAMAATINAIAIADPAGRLTYANAAFLALWGYGDAAEVLGRELTSFWCSVAEAEEMVRRLGAEGNLVGELAARRRDGSPADIQYAATMVSDDAGAPLCLIASFLDVSERNRAAAEIRQLNAQLEQRVVERTAELAAATREMEAFSYSVSHDLRAPLRHMNGFSQALLEDYGGRLDDHARNYLERIMAASRRMSQLIDDLLSLGRISRSELCLSHLDLTALARGILAELAAGDPARQVTQRVAAGLTAFGDPVLVKVLLDNLLGNAWKYTGRTAAAVIEFGVTGEAGERVFFVRDNGAGFDMQYADKLFHPFQRLHSAQEFEGTGIGLATVKRIAQRHGGRVWADGTVGAGATVYFTLG